VVDGGANTLKAGERFVVGLGVLTLEDLPTPRPPPEGVKPKLKLTSRGHGDAQAEVGPEREGPRGRA